MSEEAKKETLTGISPWDVLIWKLDSIERQVQRLDQRMDNFEQRMGSLENKTSQSYLILQWTAILGFIAVVASIFIAPLFK